jgi:hypothetical protein
MRASGTKLSLELSRVCFSPADLLLENLCGSATLTFQQRNAAALSPYQYIREKVKSRVQFNL